MKKKVLHVGCGMAPLPAGYFPEENWTEIRLDIDPGCHPDITTSMTDMAAVENGQMDAIYSSHNLEHLEAHDVPVALAEFNRVLGEDGVLVLTLPDIQSVARLVADDKLMEPAYQSPSGPISPIDIIFGFRPALACGNRAMAHRTAFTARSLQKYLADAGFRSVAIKRGSDLALYVVASKKQLSRDETLKLLNQYWANAGNGAYPPQSQRAIPPKAASMPARQAMATHVATQAENQPSPAQPTVFFHPFFWGPRDTDVFLDLMRMAQKQVASFFCSDNLVTINHTHSFLLDPAFLKAWKSNCVCSSDEAIIWRRYILAMAAFHCAHLEGDFVEAGAYQGTGSKTVLDYLVNVLPDVAPYKTFWLYDLFEHPEGALNHAMPAHGAQLYDQVKARFAGYSNVRILKGYIPDIFSEASPEKVAWLHIDLNQAPAELATLEALFDRVTPGGIIIFDDYDFLAYKSQKDVQDPWLAQRGYKVFPLPTGQGILIKR